MNSRDELEKIMRVKNATFSFNFNGYHFIILTTDIKDNVGDENAGIYKTQYMKESEIKWLKEDLTKMNYYVSYLYHIHI